MKNVTRKIIGIAMAAAVTLPAVPALAHDNDSHRQNQYSQKDSRQNDRDNHGTRVSQAAHKFHTGDRFERSKASYYRVVDYRDIRGLKAPKKGYRYVRAGRDVLLVKLSNNRVITVYSNRFG